MVECCAYKFDGLGLGEGRVLGAEGGDAGVDEGGGEVGEGGEVELVVVAEDERGEGGDVVGEGGLGEGDGEQGADGGVGGVGGVEVGDLEGVGVEGGEGGEQGEGGGGVVREGEGEDHEVAVDGAVGEAQVVMGGVGDQGGGREEG